MKLISEVDGAKLYDLGNGYNVSWERCTWTPQGYRLMIRPMEDRYLPLIFVNYEKNVIKFEIQTASYGSLPPVEIQKIIAGFQIALETIDICQELNRKEE